MSKYLGFRFDSGRKTTTGEAHPITGRYDRAGDLVGFDTQKELEEWISEEKLSAPCGLDGGERIAVSKREARKLRLGCTVEDFENEIDFL